ncbi:transposase [Betaproteobacteria bacterium]|nr:transposase [Betaproteobacteria bacterium]
MIALEDRQTYVRHIEEAHQADTRLRPACQTAGITVRTLQRWRSHGGLLVGDKRPAAERATPSHALSEEERAQVLARVNEPRFAALPPARIVPMLADEGGYLASESSFQRILRAHRQTAHRGRSRAPQPSRRPCTHIATSPGQVWCRDMTYLPTQVQGHWFYLYLIMDLYSRKIVGWEVHPRDDADHAVHLLKRTALAEGIHASVERPVLHGDNGSTLKATTALAMLNWLGIKPSYSRPRVSDDNPFVESLFKTARYRPRIPGFDNLEKARAWANDFARWYNCEHRHSGIRYVTPEQRHSGADRAILAARHQTCLQAHERNHRRWTTHTRDWSYIKTVTLNPERDTIVNETLQPHHIQALVA